MPEVLVNRLGGLSLPRKSVVRLTDHPDMTLDVYHGRKTTMQQQQQQPNLVHKLKNLNNDKYTRIKHDLEVSHLKLKVTLSLRNNYSLGPWTTSSP